MWRDLPKELLWRKLIRRQARSGLGVREFCLAEGIREGLFYRWRAVLRDRDRDREGDHAAAPERRIAAAARGDRHLHDSRLFAPVRVLEEAAAAPSRSESVLEVVLAGGAVLRIPAGYDRATLAGVLELLESPRC